jgi:hypothetical protein
MLVADGANFGGPENARELTPHKSAGTCGTGSARTRAASGGRRWGGYALGRAWAGSGLFEYPPARIARRQVALLPNRAQGRGL